MGNKRLKQIKSHHLFYIGFFALYFLGQYFFLYHINGLNPFQLNIHFFSNVIGSLSKRFLAETAPYALLFYLIYHSRRQWLRISLIGIFLMLFFLNVSELFYYFNTKTDIQFYVIKGFQWNLFMSYLGTLEIIAFLLLLFTMGALGFMLFRIHTEKRMPFAKNIVFLSLSLIFKIIF